MATVYHQHRAMSRKILLNRSLWRTSTTLSTSTRALAHTQPTNPPPQHITTSRVTRLITAQSDPLLAKAIFDYASQQPNFRHSISSYHAIILKLSRSKHFSLIDNLLKNLKSQHQIKPTPTFFSSVIKIYVEARLPDRALKAFYTMLEFEGCKPLAKHLNMVLELLVSSSRDGGVRSGYELFRSVWRYGVVPNVKSYNVLIKGFCGVGDLSVGYKLFNEMFRRGLVPDVESYRILMQGLCRKSQVNGAVDLLEDMLNKGFVPDGLCYTSLLNGLCRKKQLKEAYKLLCRMKVKGCNPDIVHYNTVIVGLCREGRAMDACKVLDDMTSNGCLPNLVSYRTLVSGLCDQGMLDEAKVFMEKMMSRGFSPHPSVLHALIKELCNVGRVGDAYEVLEGALRHGEPPHADTWEMIIPRLSNEEEEDKLGEKLEEVLKVEIKRNTRIVDAGVGLEDYLINKLRVKAKKHNVR